MATRKRRSSILKSKPRAPLQELEFNPSTPTSDATNKSRRVSFSKRKGVAEFVANEATTTWRNQYEEQNRTLENSSLGESQHQQRWPSDGDGNFQEVEAEFGSFTVMQDLNITQQIASLEGVCAETQRIQTQNFNLSSMTEQNIQFNDDFGNPHLTQSTGRLDLNYSIMQPGTHNEFDGVKDEAVVNNYENLNNTGYIEVDLNTTHITSNNASDMSITDIIQSPKVQVEVKNVTVNVTKDWITDKENILVTPLPKIAEKARFKSDDQILVFDGKKIKYAKPDDPLDEISNFGTKGSINQTSIDTEKNLSKTNRVTTEVLTKGPRLRQTFAEDGLLDFTLEIPASTKKYPDDMLTLEELNVDMSGKDNYTSKTNKVSNNFINNDVSMIETIIPTNGKSENFTDEEGNMSIMQVMPQEIEKRKTINFNYNVDQMSITKVVSPSIDKTINLEITMAQSVPQIIESRNVINDPEQVATCSIDKRKTINFNNEDGNMSLTQVIPQAVDKLHIFNFNAEDVNMSMTQVIDKRMTINFGNDEGNMSITKVVSHPIDNVRASDSRNESGDMSLTQFVPLAMNNENNNGTKSSDPISPIIDRTKTINFNNNDGNMSMTQVISHAEETSRTIHFNDVDMNVSVTQVVPHLIDSRKLIDHRKDSLLGTRVVSHSIDKMKTINFSEEDGNMSMTQVISEDIRPYNKDCDRFITETVANTVDYDNKESMSMTQMIPQIIEKRKTMNDHIDYGNMSMTQVVPQTLDKGKTINFSVNMSMTQLIPQTIDTMDKKKESINFNNADAEMSMTQIAPKVIDSIGIIKSKYVKDKSMTQAVTEAINEISSVPFPKKTDDCNTLNPDDEIALKQPSSNLHMEIQNLSLSESINANISQHKSDKLEILSIEKFDAMTNLNKQGFTEKDKLGYLTDISNLNCSITPNQVLVYSSYLNENKNATSSKSQSTISTSTVSDNCYSISCRLYPGDQSDTSQFVKCERLDCSVTTSNTEKCKLRVSSDTLTEAVPVKIKTVQSNLPNLKSLLDNFIPENIHNQSVLKERSVKELNQAQSCNLDTSIDLSSPARKIPRFCSTGIINTVLNNNEQMKKSSEIVVNIGSNQIEAANISQLCTVSTGNKKTELSDFCKISKSNPSVVLPVMNKPKIAFSLDHMTQNTDSIKGKDDDNIERSRTYHNLDETINPGCIQKQDNIVTGSEKSDLMNKSDKDCKIDVSHGINNTCHRGDDITTEDTPVLLMDSKSVDCIKLASKKGKEDELDHTNKCKNSKLLNISKSKNETIPLNKGDQNATHCDIANLNLSDLQGQFQSKQPQDLSNINIKHEQIVFNVAQTGSPLIDSRGTKTIDYHNTENASSGVEHEINNSVTDEILITPHAITSVGEAGFHSNKLISSEMISDIVAIPDGTTQTGMLGFDSTTDTDDLSHLLMESKSADCISFTHERGKENHEGHASKCKNNKFMNFFKSKIRPTALKNNKIIRDKSISHYEDLNEADLNELQTQTPLIQEEIVSNAESNTNTDDLTNKVAIADGLSKKLSSSLIISDMQNSETLTSVPDGTTQTESGKIIELPELPTNSISKYSRTSFGNENKSRASTQIMSSLGRLSHGSYNKPKATDGQSLSENCKPSLALIENTNVAKSEGNEDTIKEPDQITLNLEDTKYLIDMLGKYSDSGVVDNNSYAFGSTHPLEEQYLLLKVDDLKSIKGHVVISRKSVANKTNNLSLTQSHVTTVDSSGPVDAGGEKHLGIVNSSEAVTHIEDSLSPKINKHFVCCSYDSQKNSNILHDATAQSCDKVIEFKLNSTNKIDESQDENMCKKLDDSLKKNVFELSSVEKDCDEAPKRNKSEVSALEIVKELLSREILKKATPEENKYDDLLNEKENYENSGQKNLAEPSVHAKIISNQSQHSKTVPEPTDETNVDIVSTTYSSESTNKTTFNSVPKTVFDCNSQEITHDILEKNIEKRSKLPIPKFIESVDTTKITTLESIDEYDKFVEKTAGKCIDSINTSKTKHKVSFNCLLAHEKKDVFLVENVNVSTANESQPATSRRMKLCEGLVRVLKFTDDSPLRKPTDDYEMDPSKIAAICRKCNVIPTDLNDDRINNIKCLMHDLTKTPRETVDCEKCEEQTDQQMTSDRGPPCFCRHRSHAQEDDEDMSWINYNNPQIEQGTRSPHCSNISPRRREVRFRDQSRNESSPNKHESCRNKPLIFDPKNPLNNVLLSASYIAKNSPPFKPDRERVLVAESLFTPDIQNPIIQEEFKGDSDILIDTARPINTECPNEIDSKSITKSSNNTDRPTELFTDTEYPVITECSDDKKLIAISVKQDSDFDESMKSTRISVLEESYPNKQESQNISNDVQLKKKSAKRHRGRIGKKALKAFKYLIKHKDKVSKDGEGETTDEEHDKNDDSKEYICIDINPVSTNDLSIQNSINQIIKSKKTREKSTEIDSSPFKSTRNASIDVDLVDRYDCRVSISGLMAKCETSSAIVNTDHSVDERLMLEDTTPILIDESNSSYSPSPTADASTTTSPKHDPMKMLFQKKATLNASDLSDNSDIARCVTKTKGNKRFLSMTPNRISTGTPKHSSKLQKKNSPRAVFRTSVVNTNPNRPTPSPKKVNNEKYIETKAFRNTSLSQQNSRRCPNRMGVSPPAQNVMMQFNRVYTINSITVDTQKTAFTSPEALSQNIAILSEVPNKEDSLKPLSTIKDSNVNKYVFENTEHSGMIEDTTNEPHKKVSLENVELGEKVGQNVSSLKHLNDGEPQFGPTPVDMDISLHELTTSKEIPTRNLDVHETASKQTMSKLEKISNTLFVPNKVTKPKEVQKKKIDFGVKVAEMACFGEHCRLVVEECGRWGLLLIKRLTVNVEFDTDDVVAEDTPVKDITFCPHADERLGERGAGEAMLCVRALAAYGACALGCADVAGAMPAQLARVAAACQLAARWLRAMHVARAHIAYTLLPHTQLAFTVVNTSLDAVYEVKMELEVAQGTVMARSLAVECVYGDVHVEQAVLDALRRHAHCQWGNVPTLVWKVFRLLKSDNLKTQILSMK